MYLPLPGCNLSGRIPRSFSSSFRVKLPIPATNGRIIPKATEIDVGTPDQAAEIKYMMDEISTDKASRIVMCFFTRNLKIKPVIAVVRTNSAAIFSE